MRILTAILFLIGLSASAQVAVNTDGTNPDPSAMLDVKSTNRGMLVPRMTSAQRTAISSPASGLLVFDNSTQSFWFYSAGSWVELTDQSSQQWTPNGSSISYNAGNVGVGDATPVATFTVGAGDKFQVNGSDGSLSFLDDNASIKFPATTLPNAPMMYMFNSGTANADRMVIAHSPSFPTWGIEYKDTSDVFYMRNSLSRVFTFGLGSGRMGIGTESAAGQLHIKSNSYTSSPQLYLEEDDNDFARLMFTNNQAGSNWQIAGYLSPTTGAARLNFYHSVMGNVMSITDDGRVGINNTNPDHEFVVNHASFGLTNTNNGLCIRNLNSNNTNWTFYSYNGGGQLGLFEGSTQRGQFAAGTGAYTTVSDQRLKSDLQPLQSVLGGLLQLQAMHYTYTSDPRQKKVFGFMAQEVDRYFPELVYRTGEDQEGYALDYSGFGILAVKAIQEQQAEIEKLKEQNEMLFSRLERLEKEMQK